LALSRYAIVCRLMQSARALHAPNTRSHNKDGRHTMIIMSKTVGIVSFHAHTCNTEKHDRINDDQQNTYDAQITLTTRPMTRHSRAQSISAVTYLHVVVARVAVMLR